jgi:dTDP-4-dehydrorhamnose reductase
MYNVLVLGATGMLGHMVHAYLCERDDIDITATARNPEEAADLGVGGVINRYDASFNNIGGFLDAMNVSPWGQPDYIINCIGVIKPRINEMDPHSVQKALAINSIFPRSLAEYCEDNGIKLIHITTDCVFSGHIQTNYSEFNRHDAADVYGKSKSLGEAPDCMVIRTSIIGPEVSGKYSLLEWVKSQKGNEVNGYTNHQWNGMTTLQFAKCCHQIIQKNLWQKGIFHLPSPDSVTKAELVRIISDVYDLNVTVKPFTSPEPCNRKLSSVLQLEDRLDIPTIRQQVEALVLPF